ncbi:Variable outer membrane protein (plasmid) [Borrelia crocidurae DOU]|uniref:Variable outer membrane protein n=1 Tax=Borrelia crocidurae DOU TaxID=1293575 RepID=W5SPN0_9SPIR|nr:Vsp/OspC family lipoprotein [Borrelia crocidurae]AHH07061.1 Variable outer membrane protein [Borrelia crocidurae DOU]
MIVDMILFLIIIILMISCRSVGSGEQSQAIKSSGIVIDLKVVSKKIRDAVEFLGKVKEVHTLVKLVDELAKAIGKKIKNSGGLDDNAGQNGSLLAGVHSLMSAVNTKLVILEKTDGISNDLKTKITAVKTDNMSFINKLESEHSALGKTAAADDDSKKAILVSNGDKSKGVTELAKLNGTIDELLKSSNKIVSDAMAELVIKPIT